MQTAKNDTKVMELSNVKDKSQLSTIERGDGVEWNWEGWRNTHICYICSCTAWLI